jgi:hypothetical protein
MKAYGRFDKRSGQDKFSCCETKKEATTAWSRAEKKIWRKRARAAAKRAVKEN